MNYSEMRKELGAFYLHGDAERAKSFSEKIFDILSKKRRERMLSPTELKCLQYEVISEEFEPKIFKSCPYYFETSVLTSLSDGAAWAKGHNFPQACAWASFQYGGLYKTEDPENFARFDAQLEELLYLVCGNFWDARQHLNFNNRPILIGGLRSVYEKAEAELQNAKNEQEIEFLRGIMQGMLAIKRMAERFSEKAEEMLLNEQDASVRADLARIAECAKRVPWEAPQSFYEALNTLAFMRKAVGSLEGAGPNTFGRVDVDLYPFYRADIDKGILTEKEAYDLIAKFLVMFDCHYDHDMKMVKYADHELENTYTLGGCDAEGMPIYNELTHMFLLATENEKVIFPKIKVRFSKNSPKEYLDDINRSVIRGTSTVLYSNDDTVIPALLKTGRSLEKARDYIISGCWGIVSYDEKYDHGSYFNLLKPFEFMLHSLTDKIEKVGIDFETVSGKEDFEELYAKLLRNIEKMLISRNEIIKKGIDIRKKVDSLPIFCSTLENCIERRRSYFDCGADYYDDYLLMFGLPDIVDSLMAIKTLCFDKRKYSFTDMLNAIKANWQGYEDMRSEAIACHGWGDGNADSSELANRFNEDLYAICESVPGTMGGKVRMGHLTYTEIRWWGEKTLATPNGRYSGDCFAQGLTPSRLKKIPSVTDVIASLRAIDGTKLASNSVVNIILPGGKTTLAHCEAFLRAAADSALESLQLNCTSREQLLDAQKHPENYPDLIVRVTGFSARFTALSEDWQKEVLSRNFYE